MMKNSASAKVVLRQESKYITDIVDGILGQIKNIFRRAIWNVLCSITSLNGNAAIM